MAFNKRTIFLVNPYFQLRFSVIACSFVVISTMIYPVIILDFFQMVAEKSPGLGEIIGSVQNELLFFLILIQVVLTLLVFIMFIFFTHKIAGPMYKLKSHLSRIRDGEAITPLTFRNGDYFHDVAEEVSLFLNSVSSNHEEDALYLEEISTYLENISSVVPDDKKPVLNEISRRLIEIKSRYKKSL